MQREVDWRDSKRLERLLKAARLKVSSACLEDIDWRASRGLSREVISSLAGGDWLRHDDNVLLTGATGCGKTWLACALGQQAARLGFSVLYTRAPRLPRTSVWPTAMAAWANGWRNWRGWTCSSWTTSASRRLPRTSERPAGVAGRPGGYACSTLITSQLPVTAWHAWLDEPTLADAILDRIVHGSHKIALKGESMRKLTKAV